MAVQVVGEDDDDVEDDDGAPNVTVDDVHVSVAGVGATGKQVVGVPSCRYENNRFEDTHTLTSTPFTEMHARGYSPASSQRSLLTLANYYPLP